MKARRIQTLAALALACSTPGWAQQSSTWLPGALAPYWTDANGKFIGPAYSTNKIFVHLGGGQYALPVTGKAQFYEPPLESWSAKGYWTGSRFLRESASPDCTPPYYVNVQILDPGMTRPLSIDQYAPNSSIRPGAVDLNILTAGTFPVVIQCTLQELPDGTLSKNVVPTNTETVYLFKIVATYHLNDLFPPPLRLH